MSYATEGGPLRDVHSKHRNIGVCIPDMVEDKDTFYEQRKLRHSRWHEENNQDSWGHSGQRYKEITGVQEVTIVRRDTMKTRPVIGFARKLSKQILIRTSQKKGMIIKMRSDVTHLTEII